MNEYSNLKKSYTSACICLPFQPYISQPERAYLSLTMSVEVVIIEVSTVQVLVRLRRTNRRRVHRAKIFVTHERDLRGHAGSVYNGQTSYFIMMLKLFAKPGHFLKPLLSRVMTKSVVTSVTTQRNPNL